MNLHLIDDEKFFDPFVEKLEALRLLDNNHFVIKDCGPLKFIRRKDLVYGRMCDRQLDKSIGKYDKVFIHCFTSEMYDWVNRHTFNELNWMVWGKELYGSELLDFPLYEAQTKQIVKKVSNRRFTFRLGHLRPKNLLMRVNLPRIYGKIDNVLTWITPEYEYAINNMKGLRAKHKSFAYTFESDVEVLSGKFSDLSSNRTKKKNEIRCILGNSGVASNNHLDAIDKIQTANLKEVLIPISYGNSKYIELLKQAIHEKYTDRNVTYMDRFMSFKAYIDFFYNYDVFISNSIRPVGMGNIWMALLMGKLVFMNRRNLVFPYLRSMGLEIFDIDDISNIEKILQKVDLASNCQIAADFLSEAKINHIYLKLFGQEPTV